jgi:hypothetical protein
MNVEGTEPFDVNAVILSRMRLPLQPLSTIRSPAIHHNLIYVDHAIGCNALHGDSSIDLSRALPVG